MQAKEYYHARCAECERMKKEGVSQKEYEKVTLRCVTQTFTSILLPNHLHMFVYKCVITLCCVYLLG